MIRRPPRSTLSSSSAASDVYKRQILRRKPVSASAVKCGSKTKDVACIDQACFMAEAVRLSHDVCTARYRSRFALWCDARLSNLLSKGLADVLRSILKVSRHKLSRSLHWKMALGPAITISSYVKQLRLGPRAALAPSHCTSRLLPLRWPLFALISAVISSPIGPFSV